MNLASPDPRVTCEVGGGVATITIRQPEKRNAVAPAMWDALAEMFFRVNADPQVRAVIFTGEGASFCSGSDLAEMDMTNDVGSGLARLRRANRMVLAISKCEKPVIAAVPGPAVGVGWGLAMACDFIIAADRARFGGGFLRVGLVPDGGTLYFLTRNLGEMKARALIYTAQLLSAAEAFELGLVLEVVPADRMMQRAAEFADQLARGPTASIGLAKRLFRTAFGSSLEAYFEAEEMAQVLAKKTDDFSEGVRAFGERRPTDFKGR